MGKFFGWDKDVFWSVTAALVVVFVISGLFSHVLDHTGQKITGAKPADATFGE